MTRKQAVAGVDGQHVLSAIDTGTPGLVITRCLGKFRGPKCRGFVLTHAGSGRCLGLCTTKARALAAAKELGFTDWTRDGSMFPASLRPRVYAVLREHLPPNERTCGWNGALK